MNHMFSGVVTNKKTYYFLLTIVTVASMLLLSGNVFLQDRDGRRQIVDENGGKELMVDGTLK